jgi:hypothetical protein
MMKLGKFCFLNALMEHTQVCQWETELWHLFSNSPVRKFIYDKYTNTLAPISQNHYSLPGINGRAEI